MGLQHSHPDPEKCEYCANIYLSNLLFRPVLIFQLHFLVMHKINKNSFIFIVTFWIGIKLQFTKTTITNCAKIVFFTKLLLVPIIFVFPAVCVDSFAFSHAWSHHCLSAQYFPVVHLPLCRNIPKALTFRKFVLVLNFFGGFTSSVILSAQ